MPSTLTRRRPTTAPEPTLRLICFSLRQTQFCLPLPLAQRVVFRSGAEARANPGILDLQGHPVSVVDLAPWLYQDAMLLGGEAPADPTLPQGDQTILVIDSPRLGLLGLLVDDTPALKRARQSAFSPVPAAYLITRRLRGVHTLVNLGDGEPPMFLLDADQLLLTAPSGSR